MKKVIPFIIAMGLTIAISNVLVQKVLGNFLTYAAFTYPVAFLITDLANRLHGKQGARTVIWWGLACGVVCSLIAWNMDLTTVRIALASAMAFLTAQALDVQIFDRLRHLSWWKTPLISSIIGSVTDTLIFFFVAFSATTFLAASKTIFADDATWAFDLTPLLSTGQEAPLWVSLAVADFGIKALMVMMLLLPYRLITQRMTLKKEVPIS